MTREICCVLKDDGTRCEIPAVLVCKFYTDEGPTIIAVCKTHIMKVSGAIDELVQVESGAGE
jgi:hypothetical protein